MTRIDEKGPPIRLDEAAIERLREALGREEVVAALLFGSQATGKSGPLSDVDVAVWLDPALPREESFDLRLELLGSSVEALGTDEVDLVILNGAPPLLQHRAMRSAVRLVDRDPRTRIRLEERALLDYLDTAPLRAELARGLRRRLLEGRFGRP